MASSLAIFFLLLVFLGVPTVHGKDVAGCQIKNEAKKDCIEVVKKDHKEVTKTTCEKVGCCWSPCNTTGCKSNDVDVPWCFFTLDGCKNDKIRHICDTNENCVNIGCCYNETNVYPSCFHKLRPTDVAVCQIKNEAKKDCIEVVKKDHKEVTKTTCEKVGCCWSPCNTTGCKSNDVDVPWCFFTLGYNTTTWHPSSSQNQMSTVSGFSLQQSTTAKRSPPKSITSPSLRGTTDGQTPQGTSLSSDTSGSTLSDISPLSTSTTKNTDALKPTVTSSKSVLTSFMTQVTHTTDLPTPQNAKDRQIDTEGPKDYVVPVAVSVGLLVLIGIVIAVVMWYRCRRAERSKSDNHSSEPGVKYNNNHDVDMEPVFMHANDIYDGCEIQSDTFPDHTLREPTEVDNVSTPREAGMMSDVANPLYMAPVSTVNRGMHVTSGKTRGVDKARADQMPKAKKTANGTKEPTAQDQERKLMTNGNSFADKLENDTYCIPDATLKELTSGKDDATRSAGNKESPYDAYDVPRSLISWTTTVATDDAPSPHLKDEPVPHDHVQPRASSSGSSDTVPDQQQKGTKDGKAGNVPKESATNSSRQNSRGNRPPPKDLYAKVEKHKKGAKVARGERSDAVTNLDQVLQDLQQTNDSLEQVAIRLDTQDEDGNSKVPTSENVYVNQGYVKEHF